MLIQLQNDLCWSQPINNQGCVWTCPCDSYYDCKMPPVITMKKLWEATKKAYYLQVLEITRHTWGLIARFWVEKEKEKEKESKRARATAHKQARAQGSGLLGWRVGA